MCSLAPPPRANSLVDRKSHQPSSVVGAGSSMLTCQCIELIGTLKLTSGSTAVGKASPTSTASSAGSSPSRCRSRTHQHRSAFSKADFGRPRRASKLSRRNAGACSIGTGLASAGGVTPSGIE